MHTFFIDFVQVPALEHNNQVTGDSLDLVKYIDSNFDGPAMLPDVRQIYSIFRFVMLVVKKRATFLSGINSLAFINLQDSAKKKFAEELLAFSDRFNSAFFSCLRSKGVVSDEAGKNAE
jgi:glutathione S-transferase